MNRVPGVFEIKETDLHGRIGKLHTKSGVIETPAFLPVIDVYRQEIAPSKVKEIGFNQVITNAYLTFKRFGEEAVKKSIHGVIGFDGVVMTDSGAYQMLEYGDVDVDQETIIKYQVDISTDIGVILDVPTGKTDYDSAKQSVEKTIQRAREAVELIKDTEQVWVLPVQGAGYSDLIEESSKHARELSIHYGMLGIGGLTEHMESYDYLTVIKTIYSAKRLLPGGKPVHLFGAGHPLVIALAAALGVDTFDSASYILYARDDRYITEYGVEKLDRLEYFPCNCPVCTRYSPRELMEMDKRERTRLLAIHNLHVIRKTIERVKQAIKEGRLWEYLEELSRRHPSAYEALRALKDKTDLLEPGTPYVKGIVRGLRLYNEESTWRPKIRAYRRKIEAYLQGRKAPVIVLKPYPPKPEDCPRPSGIDRGVLVLYYTPYLGLVPEELCGVYPTIHFNYPERTLPLEVVDDMINYIIKIIKKYYNDSKIVVEDGVGWRSEASRRIRRAIIL
ncbi:MAG: tRNA guanosine(15) transglycosylase TgtA [Desulfurococcales archaeon]|nr:tRNA guanosine(15) transglycosylase TgtA [Desulfurococcales archaeon]